MQVFSDGLQIGRLDAACIGLDFERDALALVQAAQSSGLERRDMHKNILAAALRRNKSKAFDSVEELYRSDHLGTPAHQVTAGDMPACATGGGSGGSSAVCQAR